MLDELALVNPMRGSLVEQSPGHLEPLKVAPNF
jgi:hypothetical protein